MYLPYSLIDYSKAIVSPATDGTGTISLVAASTDIVGIGTAFLTELSIGDKIKTINGNIYEIDSITDDLNLKIVTPATESEPDINYYLHIPIKYQVFESENDKQLIEYLDYSYDKPNPSQETWVIGIVAREKEHADLCGPDGLADKLEDYINSLPGKEIDSDYGIISVELKQQGDLPGNDWFSRLWQCTLRVINSAKR